MKTLIILILLLKASYIFAEDFAQIRKILASDSQGSDKLGYSVDIWGDWAIAGAHLEDGLGTDRGAAYIFYRNQGGTDNWGQVKKISASDAQDYDYFGISVSIDSNIIIVGAFTEDGTGTNRGAAYLFYKNQGGENNWGEVKKINASDAADNDGFGISVSIDGDIAIAGAFEEDGSGSNCGAAYIFYKNQGGQDNWGQIKKITASDAATDDIFGYSVCISGDLILVGAYQEDASGLDNGSAYIFSKDQGGTDNWGQIKKLIASDEQNGDRFGYSVCIDGNYIVVGADREDGLGTDVGAAYIFSKDEGGSNNWGQIKKLTASDGETGDNYGSAVNVNDDYICIGSSAEDGSGGSARGAVYIYLKDYGGIDNWGEIDKITATDADDSDYFGISSIVEDGYIITGANQDDEAAGDAGAVYIFKSYTITTSSIFPRTFIGGTRLTINYTTSSTFNSGNTFTAQLSDSSGNFSSPTTIGTISATSSGTMSILIPYNASEGTGYRIRVVASVPSVTGSDNGSNLNVVSAWTQKANFGGTGSMAAIGFGVGDYAYVICGWYSSIYQDVWQYNPSTNVWTQKANFGGGIRMFPAGFVIGDTIFAGTGYDGENRRKDFWAYNTVTNSWTSKPDLSGSVRDRACGFTLSGKGYISTGYDGSIGLNDTWEYNTATKSWTQKSNYGGGTTLQGQGAGFAISNKGYILNGGKELWEYDANSNTWVQKSSYPGTGMTQPANFVINDKAYVLDGSGGQEVWEYCPSTNTWTRKPHFGGDIRYAAFGFSIHGKGYFGGGRNNSSVVIYDFWEYSDPGYSVPTISTTNVSNISSNSISSGGTIQNDGGFSITSKGICWNTTGTPTISDNIDAEGSGVDDFVCNISGLYPNTTYYIRAYATNELGTSYGEEIVFTTLSIENTFNYSSIARGYGGAVLAEQYISVKIEILSSSENSIYSESHNVYTNKYGAYTIVIGDGSVISGNYLDIDVANDNYSVNIEIDESAPYSNYTLMEKKKLTALLANSSSSNINSYKSGDIAPFIDLVDRPGWTYTGKSETVGTPETWTAMSTTNAPVARYTGTASIVWTGNEVIIWGGYDNASSTVLNEGKRYNIKTNSWTDISTTNCPSARSAHSAIWTGKEMIVWGGSNSSTYNNNGYKYDPETDTWSQISTDNAPSGRSWHFAIWTGTEMVIWGGNDGSQYLNTGAKYNPFTNTWTTISSSGLGPRGNDGLIAWTGEEVIIWGGYNGSCYNTGAKYNPVTDSWSIMSSTGAPSARYAFAYVWTGKYIILWGGYGCTSIVSDGFLYNNENNTWSTISSSGLEARLAPGAGWTGSEMIVWGGIGSGNTLYNTGKRFNNETNTWSSLPTTNAPSGRNGPFCVWAGQNFFVWGGRVSTGPDVFTYTGGTLSGALSIYWYKKD